MKQHLVFFFFCFIAVMLAVSGCKSKEKAVLRVGTNPEYPPFSYLMGNQPTGIEIDIARKIASRMKLDIDLVTMDFDDLFSALASDKIDMAISSITITPERSNRFDFSSPYTTTNQVLISRNDSSIKLSNFEDAGKYRIGSLRGTTGSIYLDEHLIDRDLMSKANLRLYDTDIESISELIKGNLDFVIIDEGAANGYAKQRPIKIAFTIPTNEKYGIAMQKGKELNDKINKAVNELLESGEIANIIKAYTK
mgnify:CR=1 FL=1